MDGVPQDPNGEPARALKRRAPSWAILLAALPLIGLVLVASSRSRLRPRSEPSAEVDAVSASVAPWLGNRERSWVLDGWGLTKGDNLAVTGEIMSDGALRVAIRTSHGFTGQNVAIEIHGIEKVSLRAKAEVGSWSDEGSDSKWSRPTGSALVNRGDWSHMLEPGSPPLILELRLHDVDGACVHGVVEIPKRVRGA
jgi:hypothetical protein